MTSGFKFPKVDPAYYDSDRYRGRMRNHRIVLGLIGLAFYFVCLFLWHGIGKEGLLKWITFLTLAAFLQNLLLEFATRKLNDLFPGSFNLKVFALFAMVGPVTWLLILSYLVLQKKRENLRLPLLFRYPGMFYLLNLAVCLGVCTFSAQGRISEPTSQVFLEWFGRPTLSYLNNLVCFTSTILDARRNLIPSLSGPTPLDVIQKNALLSHKMSALKAFEVLSWMLRYDQEVKKIRASDSLKDAFDRTDHVLSVVEMTTGDLTDDLEMKLSTLLTPSIEETFTLLGILMMLKVTFAKYFAEKMEGNLKNLETGVQTYENLSARSSFEAQLAKLKLRFSASELIRLGQEYKNFN